MSPHIFLNKMTNMLSRVYQISSKYCREVLNNIFDAHQQNIIDADDFAKQPNSISHPQRMTLHL